MFDPTEYKKAINLRFFYSQENNLAMVTLMDQRIADMISDYPGQGGY